MGFGEKVISKIAETHHVKVEASLCSRFRTPKSDCAACSEFCPVDAIELSESGPKITGGCTDCGVCYSACPNSAFSIEDGDDDVRLHEIRDAVEKKSVDIFRISCSRGDGESELILPCLSRLTETLLLEPVRAGASGVEILRPRCEECPDKKASPHLEKVLQRALHLFNMLGFDKKALRRTDISIQELIERPEKPTSRRDFLGAFGIKAGEAAADSLPEIVKENDKKPEKTFREILSSHPPKNVKRSILLDLLTGYSSVEKVEIPFEESLLLEIEVTSECTACGVCAMLCPTGAITQEEEEKKYQLKFRPHLCVNCRTCFDACMYKTLKVKKTALLNHLLDRPEMVVFEGIKSVCAVCKIGFIGSSSKVCPVCSDSQKKRNAAVDSLLGISNK